MAFSSTVLCNNVLKRAFSEKIPVTPMKLQKLLYFIACEYVQCTGQDLLSEKFGVWQYGPVLPSVYYEFKAFGRKPITNFAKDANGDSFAYKEKSAPNLKATIDLIWDSFKDMNGIQLSKITHEDGSAWSKAFQKHENTISKTEMEKDDTYKRFILC